MPELTPKLGIKKPLGNETVSRAVFNENYDIIDTNAVSQEDFAAHLADTAPHNQGDVSQLQTTEKYTLVGAINELQGHHADQNTQTATLSHGIQKITTDQATLCKAKFYGVTLVNLLGKDGNCEDTSKFNATNNATLLDDTSDYIIGIQSIEVQHGGQDSAGFQKTLTLDLNKYYLLMASIKTDGLATEGAAVYLARNDYSPFIDTDRITNTTWTSKYIKYSPSDFTGDISVIRLLVNNKDTNMTSVFNADAIRLYEIDQVFYDKIDIDPEYTGEKLAEKYPYIDSVQHLRTPAIKKWGKNLCLPFSNEWSLNAEATLISPEEVNLSASAGWKSSDGPYISVIGGQTYFMSGQLSASAGKAIIYLRFYDEDKNFIESQEVLNSNSATLEYKETAVGKTGPANAKYVVIRLNNDAAGAFVYKQLMLTLSYQALSDFEPYNEDYLYLETPLAEDETLEYIDGNFVRIKKWETDFVLDGSLDWGFKSDATGYKNVELLNTGLFTDANLDTEKVVKYNGDILKHKYPTDAKDQSFHGNDYLTLSIADTDSGWGETYTPTADEIKAYFYGWKMFTEGQPCGTNLYNGTGTKNWVELGKVIEEPNSTIGIAQLPDYPATNYKRGELYDYYKLHYKLAEPVTEVVPHEGSISLHDGDNQVEVFEGVVVRESVVPIKSGTAYYINSLAGNGSRLKNRVKQYIEIYKNGLEDINNWSAYFDVGTGDMQASIPEVDFDPTATYTVTYIALPEEFTANVVSASGEYNTNLKTLVDKLVEDTADIATDVSMIQNEYARKAQPQWIAPTLLNSWVNYGGLDNPVGYYKDEFGVVHLRGVVKDGITTSGTSIFILPEGYRPENYNPLVTISSNGSEILSRVAIETNGEVQIRSGGNTWFVLNGISFRAEQ